MGFHTPQFFLLLTVSFILFHLVKGRRLVILAVFDALFYLNAGIIDLALLLGASTITYTCALFMRGRHRTLSMVMGVGANLLNLAFFKYYYFALDGLSRLFPIPESLFDLKIALPIGISFYTFQLIAYLLDVGAGRVRPSRSFLEFWVYISFFGQVIAGPIMRASAFIPQVKQTEDFPFDPERFKRGLALLMLGLGKKLVIADTLAPFVDRFFLRGAELSTVDLWLAAYLFGFQIYFDFSAYSDMALGVGKLFGYELTCNFHSPYISASPSEFWRRWHVTLSGWVRDYLYIPMGGSRKGIGRGILALLASMVISGLWHGAALNFLLWGAYHGVLGTLYRLWKIRAPDHPSPVTRALSVFLYLNLTMFGWVFFRVRDIRSLFPMLHKMLTFSDLSTGPNYGYYFILIVGLYLCHIAEYLLRRDVESTLHRWAGIPAPLRSVAYVSLIVLILVFLRPTPNTFIYFQF